ncbi:hypothetical protein BOTCAL_0251g00140 [Botryotinia calthae]|uniref:GST C-terminal domain-containing protein n=1 Tax=Botryotinia calthae TaxID=38488 RepID=A0A4Y8CWQ4_9HELO|nr:hypothetical protein BOTCAL_0251g00140 [Botryotinia calthae]
MSGQGPYYGQAAWFTKIHSEKVDSVIDRYFGQIKRVLRRMTELDIEKEYPNFFAWHKRLMERPAVKEVLEYKAAATSG